jgi:hypothetical protein
VDELSEMLERDTQSVATTGAGHTYCHECGHLPDNDAPVTRSGIDGWVA